MRYRIGAREYSAEEAEHEVARLRALPDAQKGDLHSRGLMDDWRIAIGAGEPEPAREKDWKASKESPVSAAPPAAAATTAKSAPRLAASDRERLNAAFEKAAEGADIGALKETVTGPWGQEFLYDRADELANRLGVRRQLGLELVLHDLHLKGARVRERALIKRLEAVERDLANAERERRANPTLRYCGTWAGGEHRPGEFVTDRGSVWHCKAITKARPGDSDDWQLAVKRGRDGKDAST